MKARQCLCKNSPARLCLWFSREIQIEIVRAKHDVVITFNISFRLELVREELPLTDNCFTFWPEISLKSGSYCYLASAWHLFLPATAESSHRKDSLPPPLSLAVSSPVGCFHKDPWTPRSRYPSATVREEGVSRTGLTWSSVSTSCTPGPP